MNVSAETMKLDCQRVEGPAASAAIENDVGLRAVAAVLPPRTRERAAQRIAGFGSSLGGTRFREGPRLRCHA